MEVSFSDFKKQWAEIEEIYGNKDKYSLKESLLYLINYCSKMDGCEVCLLNKLTNCPIKNISKEEVNKL